MKKRTVLIYDPYLDTLGGGERYILSIAQVFDECGFEITLMGKHQVTKEDIKNRFGMEFTNLKLKATIFSKSNTFKKTIFTSDFDYFFYVTNGSYFSSLASKNYVYAMVPNKNLYKNTILNKIKLRNYHFLTHSKFVKKYLDGWTGKSSLNLYPYIPYEFISIDNSKKKNQILSVGRFFEHLHSKRQDILIESFKKLKQVDSSFKDFKLILAGGLKEEDKSYLDELKKIAESDPNIAFAVNPSFSEIRSYYKESLFYWHAAGFGVDEDKHPDLVEHLGMTPLEAMAEGCIVFCHNSGGPKEIIQNGINGFLYTTEIELIDKTASVYQNQTVQNKVREAGLKLISNDFSYERFKKKVIRDFDINAQ